MTYQKTVELLSADNTTVYLTVMHEAISLRQVPAASSAANFGRLLGCAMCGKSEQCKPQLLIIRADRRRKDIRTPVPEDETAIFELPVRRNISKSPKQHKRTLAMPLIRWAWILNSNFNDEKDNQKVFPKWAYL